MRTTCSAKTLFRGFGFFFFWFFFIYIKKAVKAPHCSNILWNLRPEGLFPSRVFVLLTTFWSHCYRGGWSKDLTQQKIKGNTGIFAPNHRLRCMTPRQRRPHLNNLSKKLMIHKENVCAAVRKSHEWGSSCSKSVFYTRISGAWNSTACWFKMAGVRDQNLEANMFQHIIPEGLKHHSSKNLPYKSI